MSDEGKINEREAPQGNAPPTPDLSQMLDKVLSNPQIISAVASALSQSANNQNASPAASDNVQAQPTPSAAPTSPDIDVMMQRLPEVMKLISPMVAQNAPVPLPSSKDNDKRACLLSAIKPYMSPARCEAIDYIIKFSQLSEILKKLN